MPAQFVKHFVQDLTQDIKIRQCGTIVFNKDNESNILSVDLYNGTEEYSGGGSVAGACICPDGSTVPLTGSIDGKTASVTLTGDCFAFPGQIGIGVQVISATVKTTVLKAIYNVELFETDDVVDPGSRLTVSVADLVQEINDALANIPASDANIKAAMAPVFSTSTAYKAGQYVWYEGQLYKFTADHAAGGWVEAGTDTIPAELGADVSRLDTILTKSSIFSITHFEPVWETGSINSTGDERPTAGWIRTDDSITINDDTSIRISFVRGNYTGIIMRVFSWDADNTFINTPYSAGTYTLNVTAGTRLRFGIGPSSGSSVVVDTSDGNNLLKVEYDTILDIIPDTTLSIPGRSADSKAVGDALTGIDDNISDVEDEITEIRDIISDLDGFDEPIAINWQTGNISATGTNTDSSSTKIIRTATPWTAPGFSKVYYEVPEGYYLRVFIRYSDSTKKSDTPNITGNGYFELGDGERFRLTLQLINGNDIDISTASALFKLYGKTTIPERVESLTDVSERNTMISYMNFSIFEKFGVIGDSFASGSLHHPDDGGWTGNYQMSWPQILARKTGSVAINFTHGGRSTKTWLTDNTYGLPALLAAPAQQLYIIALGINDNTQIENGTLTLGTIADVNIPDYTQNPDTFFGCYGRIIGNIKDHAPYAKIVCLSVARLQERNMDQYIQQIAEKYGLPYIDLKTDPYFVSTIYYGSLVDSHPLTYGYAGMANAIERLIILDVLNNTTYWGTYYGLVDTDDSGDPDE